MIDWGESDKSGLSMKLLLKLNTFDSITIHTDSHSQNQKPLTPSTSLSISPLTCRLSLDLLPPYFIPLFSLLPYLFLIYLNVEKLENV